MLIDTHAHLDMDDFDKDRDEVLDRALRSGVSQIITIGIDVESSHRAVDLAKQNASLFATVGCHPHGADSWRHGHLDQLAELASGEKVVGWGEIGLDFHRLYSSRGSQVEAFKTQIERAKDLRLPVIIHDRDAHEEILAILKKMGKGEALGVIHCFSGDVEFAETLMDLGYFISIPGTVTYKQAGKVREVASKIPMERMLVETDAPYLAPIPHRGKRNEPAYAVFTAQEIARLRRMDFDDFAAATSQNARVLFGLP